MRTLASLLRVAPLENPRSAPENFNILFKDGGFAGVNGKWLLAIHICNVHSHPENSGSATGFSGQYNPTRI